MNFFFLFFCRCRLKFLSSYFAVFFCLRYQTRHQFLAKSLHFVFLFCCLSTLVGAYIFIPIQPHCFTRMQGLISLFEATRYLSVAETVNMLPKYSHLNLLFSCYLVSKKRVNFFFFFSTWLCFFFRFLQHF